MKVTIARRRIGDGEPVFLIAEAGVNHNGRMALARKLIDVAKAADADAVKFQVFVTDNLVDRSAPKAPYQKRSGTKGEKQYEMLKRLELSFDQFEDLKAYCDKKGIMFLATPFDFDSLDFLRKLGVQAFKISSGDFVNLPFLREVARTRRPMILSTGMTTLDEIRLVVRKVSALNDRLILLHCTTNYPTPMEQANLMFLRTLKKAFKYPIGFSDHTEGALAAIIATSLGAALIEKHFTLDRGLPGPDHACSMEPRELKDYISSVRTVSVALGKMLKELSKDELANKRVATKSIIAVRSIQKGARISMNDLGFRRPGTGLSPLKIDSIVGKRAKRAIHKGKVLKASDIEGRIGLD